MTVHPSPEQLAGWIDYGLQPFDMQAVEAHLVECDECRHIVFCVTKTYAELELLKNTFAEFIDDVKRRLRRRA
jgi:predicted anti-sigma-YlaC factor YlaD